MLDISQEFGVNNDLALSLYESYLRPSISSKYILGFQFSTVLYQILEAVKPTSVAKD